MRLNEPVTSREIAVSDAEPLVSKTDTSGRIVFANKAFVEVSGHALEELIVKIYGTPEGALGRYSPGECIGAEKRPMTGRPDPAHISTSYVERQNLNLRMGMRRFTRLTNAFSKSAEAHYAMMCLYVVFHNFIRDHKSLRMTPAEAAGLVTSAMTVSDIAALIDARAEPPKPRGKYKPRQPKSAA
jgi:hypothetical protein